MHAELARTDGRSRDTAGGSASVRSPAGRPAVAPSGPAGRASGAAVTQVMYDRYTHGLTASGGGGMVMSAGGKDRPGEGGMVKWPLPR